MWSNREPGLRYARLGAAKRTAVALPLPRAIARPVRLVCRPCRVKQTLTPKGHTRTLVRLRGKRLRRGQTLTVTITKPGLVGRVITRKVKRYGRTRAAIERAARRPLTETVRCIPVGATTPAKKC